MHLILPGLYVGSFDDSVDSLQLNRYQISHIVAIYEGAKELLPDKRYLCVEAGDSPQQNLWQHFFSCNDFIHEARLGGGAVLVHCMAGVSRSVAVAVAYVMCVTSLDWKRAMKVVRAGRTVANPNAGFQMQLQDFQVKGRLQKERRRLKERFPHGLALEAADEEACEGALLAFDRRQM